MVSSVWVFKCDCQYTWGHSHKDVLTTVTSGKSRLLIVIYCTTNGLFLIGMIAIATSVPCMVHNRLSILAMSEDSNEYSVYQYEWEALTLARHTTIAFFKYRLYSCMHASSESGKELTACLL